MTVERHDTVHRLAPEYEALFEESADQSLFLSLSWFKNFERTVVTADRLTPAIYGLRAPAPSGHPLAALALARSKRRAMGLSIRTVASMSNFYTSYFGIVAAADVDVEHVADRFTAALWDDRAAWDVIDLHPLDVESPVFEAFLSSFGRMGIPRQRYFCFGNWHTPIDGRSFHDYLQARPSVLRNTIARKTRKLERSGRFALRILTDDAELDRAMADYQAVYGSSWKQPEPYPAFMQGLVQLAAARGGLRLGVAYVGGTAAAAQVWIVHAGVAYIYKLAYDERFADLSVGTVLTARLMEHVIDVDKVRDVDYLTGDDPYKKDWMTHRRERWGILAFNPRTPRGVLMAARHLGAAALRRFAGRTFGRRRAR